MKVTRKMAWKGVIVGTIELNLVELLEERGLSDSDLANIPGIEEEGATKILDGKVSAIRLSSLAAFCDALQCEPGDVLKYTP